jgi:hypothetical protein
MSKYWTRSPVGDATAFLSTGTAARNRSSVGVNARNKLGQRGRHLVRRGALRASVSFITMLSSGAMRSGFDRSKVLAEEEPLGTLTLHVLRASQLNVRGRTSTET